jgi:predicted transcriptional regulator
MKVKFSAIEYEILNQTARGSIEQKSLLDDLLCLSGESYCYLRLRDLVHKGMVTRERVDGQTILNITPAGRNLLAVMQTAKEAGL